MKRFYLLSLLLSVICVGANAQLLYKISADGVGNPSYIIGTYHLAPASFVDSIPGARFALETVQQVCGELDMNEMQSSENTKLLKSAMTLPDGKKLADVLTEDEMGRLNAYMKKVLGADLTNPLIRSQLGKMTPMAITSQLQLLQYMKMTPGFNPMALIDSYFQTEALKLKKSVIGFETVSFQAEVLYGSSIERQKEQLFCMIDNPEYTEQKMKSLTDAYFSQDMNAIFTVFEETVGNCCDATPEENDKLIYNRNADWVQKIPAIIADKSTLFVVGAGHLPGERGVLNLLREAGYTVEAVRE